ncbi:hypothetical protein DIPPA_06761 [Diplonema papillatum]|nr:hypothetical protein DIPPA_06761 [Diplonema papillatum]KAJ9458231.1 hypothetical protein DIPPA_06761 [Diplonema papillatum]
MPSSPKYASPPDPTVQQVAANGNPAEDIGVQSLLMQNFTSPSQKIANIKSVSTFYHVPDGKSAPEPHTFVSNRSDNSDSNNKFFHLAPYQYSLTGWASTELALPSGAWPRSIVGGTGPNNSLVVFVLSRTKNEVFYQTAQPDTTAADPKRPVFTSDAWISLGTWYDASLNWGQLSYSPEQKLYAMFDKKSSSADQVVEIKWQNSGHEWKPLNLQKHGNLYSISAVCVWVGEFNDGKYTPTFYDRKDNHWDAASATKKYHDIKIERSYLYAKPKDSSARVYGLGSDNVLRYYNRDSRLHDPISVVEEVLDFTVVAHKDPDTELVMVIKTDNTLWEVTYRKSTQSFTPPFQAGSKATLIDGATMLQGEPHSAMMYVSTASDLMELNPTSTSSYQRTHVVLDSPIPTNNAPKATKVSAGMHKGEPMVVTLDTNSNLHVATAIDTTGLWTTAYQDQTLLLPNKKSIKQFTNVTGTDGRMLIFAEDSNKHVWRWTGGVTGWVEIDKFPSSNHRILSAGLIDGETVCLASYTDSTSGKTSVWRLPVNGTETEWKCISEGYYKRIYDLSFGWSATEAEQGYYVAETDASDKDRSIRFHRITSSGQQASLGKQQSDIWSRVFGFNTKHTDCFAIKDSDKSLWYLSTEHSDYQVSSKATSNVTTMVHDDRVYLYAMGTDNKLRRSYMKYEDNGNRPSFHGSMSIVATGIKDAVAFDWDSPMYGWCTSGYAVKLLQDKLSSSYKPDHVHVTAKSDSEASEFKSWETTIKTVDRNGNGVPNVQIRFKPLEDDVQVVVNGKALSLNQDDPEMIATSNGRGVVTFTTIATSLHAPAWLVQLINEKNKGGVVHVVEPNREEQLFLSVVTKDQLDSAKKRDGDGEKLFPDGVSSDFVDSVNSTAAMAAQGDATPGVAPNFMAARYNHTSTLCTAMMPEDVKRFRTIDPTKVKNKNFHIRFEPDAKGNRHCTFRKGTSDEAKLWTDGVRTTAAADAAIQYDGLLADFLMTINEGYGILDPDSDSLIVTDSAYLQDMVVREEMREVQGGDGKGPRFIPVLVIIAVAIVGAAVYKYEGDIESPEDVMLAVQALFSSSKKSFEDVYEWLGSFFNWKDIMNMQKLLEAGASKMGDRLEDTMQDASDFMLGTGGPASQGQGLVDNPPDGPKSGKTGDDEMDEFNTELDEVGTNGRSGQSETKSVPGDDPRGNWLLDKVQSVLGVLNLESILDFGEDLWNLIRSIMDGMENVLKTIGESAMNAIMDLGNILTEKGTAVSMDDLITPLQTMMAANMNVATDSFKTMQKNVAKLVSGVIGILDRKLPEIPFLSALWRTISGKNTLSLLKLFTLIPAIPATLAYKLHTLTDTLNKKNKPYAMVVDSVDSSDPMSVKYQMTINDAMGLGWKGAQKKSVVRGDEKFECPAEPSRHEQNLSFGFGITYSFCYYVLSANALPFVAKISDRPGLCSVNGLVTFVANIVAQVVSAPAWFISGSHNEMQSWETFIWSWQCVFNATDLLKVLAWWIDLKRGIDPVVTPAREKETERRLNVFTTIWGAAHVAWFIPLSKVEKEALNLLDKNSKNCGGVNTSMWATFGLKIGQNFTTAIGEVLDFPVFWEQNKIPPTLYATTAQNVVGFFLPATLQLIRAIVDREKSAIGTNAPIHDVAT